MKAFLRGVLAGVVTAALALPLAAVAADGYPNRLVKLVIPYTPGAHADLLARTLAQKLSEMWKQPVIVDNRPGGGGSIGTAIGARSAPDGYTLIMSALGQLVIFPAMQKTPPYDLLTDFEPVVPLVRTPWVLYINNEVPATNLKEFIAYAKSKPDGLNGATTGVGTTQHLANVLLMKQAGFKAENVHYAGSAGALQDLMANRDQFLFDSLLTRKYVTEGRLKAIGISSLQRSPYAPELPTLNESGLPGFDVSVWFGLLFPAKTPADIVTKVNADVRTAMSSKEVQDHLAVANFEYIYNMSPAEFTTMARREHERWTKVVHESGIKSE
jgi:tripartite-type tricarboxylate transporter receptor subunit TctC